MEQKNEMMITFDSRSSNESFARVAVAAFTTQLNPTLEEVADIKTAVSEAITNAIIHGYDNQVKKIRIRCRVSDRTLYVEVEDDGKGIADVKKAMEPMYTTRPDLDRSGMGFAFMEAFMDQVEVESEAGVGTIVRMKKTIGQTQQPVAHKADLCSVSCDRHRAQTKGIRRRGTYWWKRMSGLSGVSFADFKTEVWNRKICFRSEPSG